MIVALSPFAARQVEACLADARRRRPTATDDELVKACVAAWMARKASEWKIAEGRAHLRRLLDRDSDS